MAEIINLRQARKAKAKAGKDAAAEANRLKHGQTKAARQERQAGAELAKRRLDGHRLRPDEPGAGDE